MLHLILSPAADDLVWAGPNDLALFRVDTVVPGLVGPGEAGSTTAHRSRPAPLNTKGTPPFWRGTRGARCSSQGRAGQGRGTAAGPPIYGARRVQKSHTIGEDDETGPSGPGLTRARGGPWALRAWRRPAPPWCSGALVHRAVPVLLFSFTGAQRACSV